MKSLRGQARVEFLARLMSPLPATLYLDSDTRQVCVWVEPVLVKAAMQMDRIAGHI